MSRQPALADRLDLLREAYAATGGPSPEQWRSLLSVPLDRPVTLVNLFALRDVADYGGASHPPATGQEAFGRYAAVSAPALQRVGGRFLHLGAHHGNLVGDSGTWDLVVVGEYPDVEALVALHEDPDYRVAYEHRVAACARQEVLISA
ncbi:DUF1330 domain-containing protein [Nocardioides sp. BYT-33-1]|uniref:DUF1330 domain-containing protein n=1 Tax=Nocardioides sp. BYT-33-1 TaxID=3416952 RepID=UPI003F5361BE